MNVFFKNLAPVLKLTLGAGLLVACANDDVLPQIDVDDAHDAVEEQRAGSLLAEFHHPRQWREGGMSVHAQFLDVRGMAVEMAMEALEVWTPDARLEPSTCRIRTPDWSNKTPTQGPLGLHLLDVGPITIDSPTHRLRLDGRRLPDLLGAFYGVLYDMEQGLDAAGDVLAYHPYSLYHFKAPGLVETGGFAVDMIAPEPIQLVGITYRDTSYDGALSLPSGSDLILSWIADESSGMDVYIDVATGVGPDHPRLKCRADDKGTFTIASSVLESFLEDASSVDITIRRVTTNNAAVEGLDEALFIMAATDQVTVVFEP